MYDKRKAEDMLENRCFLEGWYDIEWRRPRCESGKVTKKEVK